VAHQEISGALFLQNVCKNRILTNIVQLVKKYYNLESVDRHLGLGLGPIVNY